MTGLMKIHPLCDMMPISQPDEYEVLKANIEANGFDARFPIVLFEGMILDGRHRWRVCEETKTKPVTTDFEGTERDAALFVLRANTRRNLTTGQRAMCVQALMPYIEGAAKERQEASRAKPGEKAGSRAVAKLPPRSGPPPAKSREVAAKVAGVSPRSVQDAKSIAAASPEIAAKVKSGEVSIGKAKVLIRTPPPPPKKKQSEADIALGEETAARFKELVNRVHLLKRDILALAADPLGRELRAQDIEREMKNIAGWIKAAVPFKECPFRGCTKTCKTCHGTRWVSEMIWNNIPKEARGA